MPKIAYERTFSVNMNSQNLHTVCKFQDFSVIQILREINFGEFRSFKTANAIFPFLGDLNFVNLVNFSLLKVQKCI